MSKPYSEKQMKMDFKKFESQNITIEDHSHEYSHIYYLFHKEKRVICVMGMVDDYLILVDQHFTDLEGLKILSEAFIVTETLVKYLKQNRCKHTNVRNLDEFIYCVDCGGNWDK